MKIKQLTFIWILFIITCFSPFTSHAQFEKGHKLVGGNFGFTYIDNSADEHYYKSGSFRISPTIGYFISEKSMFGFSPTVSLTHNTSS